MTASSIALRARLPGLALALTAGLTLLPGMPAGANGSADRAAGRTPPGKTMIIRPADEETVRRAFDELEKVNRLGRTGVGVFSTDEHGVRITLAPNPEMKNIRPLAGLPIVKLSLAGSGVTDLSPLRGAPLRELDLKGCKVRSLAGLESAPLEILDIVDTGVSTVSPLANRRLSRLSAGSAFTDMRSLQGMPLTCLMLEGCLQVSDLGPLQGAPLERLRIVAPNGITTLAPLRGMRLRYVAVMQARIRDLGGLEGAPLQELYVSGCVDLADIRAIQGAPLTRVDLRGTKVKDVLPLAASRGLECVLLPGTVTNAEVLKGLPSLAEIGLGEGCPSQRAAQFWKDSESRGVRAPGGVSKRKAGK